MREGDYIQLESPFSIWDIDFKKFMELTKEYSLHVYFKGNYSKSDAYNNLLIKTAFGMKNWIKENRYILKKYFREVNI